MSDQNSHTRVLLIEDNPGDVRLISGMIADAGLTNIHMDTASRLSVGIKRLASNDVDVLLLDLGLPDSKGIDTLKKITEQGVNIPVVVLTGLEDEAVGLDALREGAQDYLVKTQLNGNLLIRAILYAQERKRLEKEKVELINQLQEALAKVKTLSGLLPICVSCKKIRDDTGYWNQIEVYISEHSGAEFSHGLCPECATKLYPNYYGKNDVKK